jgi:membrane-bound serine protease (ClpP class)
MEASMENLHHTIRLPDMLRWMRMCCCIVAIALLLALPAAGTDDRTPDQQAASTAGPTVVPGYRQANKVAVLRIEGVIDRVTLRSLERRVARAVREGATAIVLDINTPGGEVSATLDICHLLKTEAPANTVAWINPQAYSAGTIIALAAREIVVQDNASFGDAAPIAVSPFGNLHQLPAAERAKLESPILEEVIDSARRHHYDEKLVQAFVSVGVELWLVEHTQTGDRIFVDRAEYRTIFGEEPPQRLTSTTPSFEPSNDDRVVPWFERFAPPPSPQLPQQEGEGTEASSSEFFQQLPSSRPELSVADRGQYRLLKQVTAADRLLTVRPSDAQFYGLAAEMIRNDEELQAFFGAQELVRYDQAWSESMARFLMSPPVRLLLIVVFLVSLFIELAVPGTGMFGAAAVVALLIFFGAPALMGMSQWWGILLVAAGLVLLGIELFVLPGVGLAGALGLLTLMVGLIGTFVTGDLGTVQGQNQLWVGITTTITAVFAAGIVMWLISRQMHSVPVLDRLILRSELSVAQQQSAPPCTGDSGAEAAALQPGDIGVAHTGLRPAGRAMFNDRIVDVQSLGGFIEEGTPVQIVSVGRYVIEVEEANS